MSTQPRRGEGRVPPHNLNAEESLLGAMLLQSAPIYAVIEMGLTVSDFYKPIHQYAFDAIMGLHRGGQPVDAVTVADDLRRAGLLDECGGPEFLLELQNATPAISNAHRYAKIIQDTATLRNLIKAASEIAEVAYGEPNDVVGALADAHGLTAELLDAADVRLLRGYYDDMATLDPGGDRDESQPWIATGVLRRHQRGLVVAKAGIGKSTFLRQLAFCCCNGVHPYTGQPTEKPRNSLVVELEAGEWDVASSMRALLHGLQRSMHTASVWDLNRPALLHRPGGIDIREPQGYAILEAAIRRAKPELVVMGPVKYLSIAKGGENYEVAALNLMGLLNGLLEKYDFALVMEVHFSRGDHGAPGGSERWVDWPDVGFGIHPPNDDVTSRLVTGGDGMEMTVKQFRTPRDGDIWLPSSLIRGRSGRLPWSVLDRPDSYRHGTSLFAARYGGVPDHLFSPYDQGQF